MVELVRRTRQGGYQVQFFADFLPPVKALLQAGSINLPNFGRWKLAPTSTTVGSMALVVGGVPLNIQDQAFREELILCNATRFRASGEGPFGDFGDAILSVTRLPRRVKAAEGGPQWVPSSSMRVSVPRPLGEAILAQWAPWCWGSDRFQFGCTPPRSALAFGVVGRAMLLSIAGAVPLAGTVGSPTPSGSAHIGELGRPLLAGMLVALNMQCRMELRG